jgi:hypothetical protein
MPNHQEPAQICIRITIMMLPMVQIAQNVNSKPNSVMARTSNHYSPDRLAFVCSYEQYSYQSRLTVLKGYPGAKQTPKNIHSCRKGRKAAECTDAGTDPKPEEGQSPTCYHAVSPEESRPRPPAGPPSPNIVAEASQPQRRL